MVKLVANMHGNEVVGREMLLKLAGLLLTRSHPAAERILDSIDLHILVSLNPDGFEKIKSAGAWVDCSQNRQNVTGGHGRFNANNVRVQHKYVDTVGTNLLFAQPKIFFLRNHSGTFRDIHW